MPGGIDLAKYQGDGAAHGPAPDWSAIPPLELVSAKASQGTTELDSSFAHNWAGARARGVRWRFANHLPSMDPPAAQIAQLDRALEAAGVTSGLELGEGVALDIEPDLAAGIPSLPPAFAVELAGAFAEHYSRPAVLAYEGFFEPSWRALIDAGHYWWLPWPYPQLGVDGAGRRWFSADTIALVTAWQYGQGHVAGIVPVVDLDRAVIDTGLDAACGLAPDPPGGDSMGTVVIELEDADAVFEGEQSSQGLVTFVRWIDGARRAVLLGEPFNCPVLDRAVAGLAGMSLIGPVPTDDTRHAWTGAEFYRYTAPAAAELVPHYHNTSSAQASVVVPIPPQQTGAAIPL